MIHSVWLIFVQEVQFWLNTPVSHSHLLILFMLLSGWCLFLQPQWYSVFAGCRQRNSKQACLFGFTGTALLLSPRFWVFVRYTVKLTSSACPTSLAVEQKLGLGQSAKCDSHSSASFDHQVFVYIILPDWAMKTSCHNFPLCSLLRQKFLLLQVSSFVCLEPAGEINL